MANITAGNIKSLRERTGAGMMDCKRALVETDGEMDVAIDYLRKKGLSARAKKAGRITAEGMVTASVSDSVGVILEVNTETDFVAKNSEFKGFVQRLTELISAVRPVGISALMDLPIDEGRTVSEALSEMVSRIGENITIRRFESIQVDDGVIGAYIHAGGRIATLVGIDTGRQDQATAMARDIAMHAAAANPQYIYRGDVPASVVDHEKSLLRERAVASGKPEAVIERIISGQLNKFFSENCLVEQPFIKNPDQLISDLLKSVDSEAKVTAMYRYQLGEGIEKRNADFAAEVAAQIHG